MTSPATRMSRTADYPFLARCAVLVVHISATPWLVETDFQKERKKDTCPLSSSAIAMPSRNLRLATLLALLLSAVPVASAADPDPVSSEPRWDDKTSAGLRIPHDELWSTLQSLPGLVELVFKDEIANYTVLPDESVRILFMSGETMRLAIARVNARRHAVTLAVTQVSEFALIEGFQPLSLALRFEARPYAGHAEPEADASSPKDDGDAGPASVLSAMYSVRARKSQHTRLSEARAHLSAMLRSSMDCARAQMAAFPCVAEFRSFSGICNNVGRWENAWGRCHVSLRRVGADRMRDPAYAPGQPAHEQIVDDINLPNARTLSRALFAQAVGESVPSVQRLSALCVFWGQFVDHDVGLTPESEHTVFEEEMPIFVEDERDEMYKRHNGHLNFFRSITTRDGAQCCGNGIHEGERRNQPNMVTSFVDASQVYGCSKRRVRTLRSFEGGRLRTGDKWRNGEDMLPRNKAPDVELRLANALSASEKHYVGGDTRVNEQPVLLALHTLFVREHNRVAGVLRKRFECWGDEQVFQYARRIVAAQVQQITYRDFVPALLGTRHGLSEYTGYRKGVDATMSNVFLTCAFRIGHSMVPDTLHVLQSGGKRHVRDGVALHDVFFDPDFVEDVGIEALLLGSAHQRAEEVDMKVVDSLRNKLFVSETKGVDLVALNIQRGRDHGIPRYNDVRELFGLPRMQSFEAVSNDADVVAGLRTHYRSVDDVDCFVGGLAERHVQGAVMGEMLHAVMREQFERARDGDRLFYAGMAWAEEMKDVEEVREIMEERVKLSKIVVRNGGGEVAIDDFADDVFHIGE